MINYLNTLNYYKVMSSKVDGVLLAIELEDFIEIETKTIMKRGRIHIDPKYARKYIITYISKVDCVIRKEDRVELPTRYWTEVTQKTGSVKTGTKAGDPLTVSKNGDITGPYNILDADGNKISTCGLYAKVFVRRSDGE